MVQQPVQQRRRQYFVSQQGAPLGERQVARQYDRAPLVAQRHQLEERLRLLPAQPRVAHLVDHQQLLRAFGRSASSDQPSGGGQAAAFAESIEAFVREVLVPVLRPGQIVLMDNLSSHKRPAVRQLVEQTGACLRFLPRYSPEFNPIELAWAKMKRLLRSWQARTEATLDEAEDSETPEIRTASDDIDLLLQAAQGF
jgi:transposase